MRGHPTHDRMCRTWERSPPASAAMWYRCPNRDLRRLVRNGGVSYRGGWNRFRLRLHHTQRGDDMRLTRHSRWMAPVVGAAAVGLALTGCTGDVAQESAADVDCGPYEQYGTFDG